MLVNRLILPEISIKAKFKLKACWLSNVNKPIEENIATHASKLNRFIHWVPAKFELHYCIASK